MMRRLGLLPILLLAACAISVGGPVSYEVIDVPVAFWFDAHPRDQSRIANIAEELEPHFPDMSWRIGTYEPESEDGIVVQVRERQLRDFSRQNCENCLKTVAVFTIYDRGRHVASEEFEDCSIYRPYGDCFSVRRLVDKIDGAVKRESR